MNRALTLAALLCLAACSQQQPAPANEAESAPAGQVAEKAVPSLEGSWDVTAIDGRPVDASSAMVASFSGGNAIVASGCLRRAWTYRQNKNVVTFAAYPGGSANCQGRGTTAQQETAYAALQEANIAIFGKDGSEASLSGTGGNLTLQRR